MFFSTSPNLASASPLSCARADAAVAKGLQAQGCYWHLDTRPDEWESMPERGWQGRLKHAAKALDRRLKGDPSQCCVHGDLKADNMCFDGQAVGMCDFQYCGKACAAKDLAYLLCCAADEGCSRQSSEKYATYFSWLMIHEGQMGIMIDDHAS